MMKKMGRLAAVAVIGFFAAQTVAAKDIVHDGEFNFLKAQYADAWADEDKQVDAKLAELRQNNGGKRPNILYVLIDDVSFGQMGKPAMNDGCKHHASTRSPARAYR
jgi:arylsulfatase